MVLAAGRSSRLGEAARGLPKPLVPVGGRAPLDRTLGWLAASGISHLWINLHHGAAAVRAAVGDGARYGLLVRYSEERELLGTAGGWARVARADRGPARWLVLYGDNVMHFDLRRLLARHEAAVAEGLLGTVALFDPERHRHSGIAGGGARLGARGRIQSFVEGVVPAGALVNAGAYVLERVVVDLVPAAPSDFGRDVLPGLAQDGKLAGHVLEVGAYCFGVDTPERLEIAETMLAAEVP